MVIDPPRPVAEFQLTDQDGQPFSSSSLRGRPALVFFGYAHCPDVCPAALAKLKMLQSQGEDVRRAQVVFVSVDGERDDAAAVKEYLTRLSPDFIGLTGDPEVVRGIAEGFRVAFFREQPGADASAYEVEHSGQIYLIDADGQFRAELYDPSVETIAAAVRTLL
jgi:protein SCO1/2